MAANQPHELVQARLGAPRAEMKVLRAALGVEAARTAIASIKVDLPAPFSPMKNVTLAASASSSSERIAGIENG